MKSNIACILCGAAVAVAVTSGPAVAQTIEPSAVLMNMPMQAHRNADGTIKRGLRNTIVTGYWSGYAATASAPYTSASGTWQVPSASYDGVTPVDEYSSTWVGIGGYFDSTLIQLGTYQDVSTANAASYSAWYELYPAGALYIPHAVKPGDIVTASLRCTAACVPNSVQTWQLTMTDETAGWTWNQNVQYQSSMVSAEWILEAPWGSSEYPLADIGQMTFDPVSANGLNPNLSLSANGIQMSDPWGETSNPSDPVNGNAFSTCWGLAPNYTPCTTGSFTTPPSAPTASLSANPKSIAAGQSSTLTWSSVNASSCTGSGFPASGTSGNTVVHPSVTTSYAVTCTGNGGSAKALATVTISSPKICHAKHC
jgi:Peptidase A4 family